MNHIFASSQRVLTGDVLHKALEEINQRRFEGVYNLRRTGDNWHVHLDMSGRMSETSFKPPHEKSSAVFDEGITSQKLWKELHTWGGSPGGEACLESCRFRNQCSVPSDYHYFICAFAHHNKLPLETKEEPVERKTRFEILQGDD